MHERIKDLLEEAQIPFRLRLHRELPIPIRSPSDFAIALGYEHKRIAKTILLRNQARSVFCLATLPAKSRLNLTAIADNLQSGRLELASSEELSQVLGYPPMSVSPLGATGIAVFLDRHLTECETVLIGAGTVGEEIEIAPEHLISVTEARVADLTK
jgi:Cys-tRNA(Pro)/Cys-tRNA(Cys) deacylase